MSRKGMECQGNAWQHKAREFRERKGIVRKVMVRHDNAWQGMACQGKERKGKERHENA
jgi:hypothetical protein